MLPSAHMSNSSSGAHRGSRKLIARLPGPQDCVLHACMARGVGDVLLQAALASPAWQCRAAEALLGPSLLACFDGGAMPPAGQLQGDLDSPCPEQQAAAQWACAAGSTAQVIALLMQLHDVEAEQGLRTHTLQPLLSCFAALARTFAAEAMPPQGPAAAQLRLQRAAALQHVAHAAALLLASGTQVILACSDIPHAPLPIAAHAACRLKGVNIACRRELRCCSRSPEALTP